MQYRKVFLSEKKGLELDRDTCKKNEEKIARKQIKAKVLEYKRGIE